MICNIRQARRCLLDSTNVAFCRRLLSSAFVTSILLYRHYSNSTLHNAMNATVKSSTQPKIPTIYWREIVYAATGGVSRPSTTRKVINVSKGAVEKKWSARNIVGESLRVAGFCPHVAPKPPVHVHGLPPSLWEERLNAIEKHAAEIKVPYSRGGRAWTRKLKSDTPILLMAVASYPGDPDVVTPERQRWEKLVIESAKSRWGDRLRSAIAHVDESQYHLHLWIDDDGRPVKRLHGGHAAAMAVAAGGGTRAAQGRAYKAGVVNVLAWHHASVGEPLGWRRASEAPKPRRPHAAAVARRLREAEAAEAALQVKAAALKAVEAAQAIAHAEAEARHRARMADERDALRATWSEVKAERKNVAELAAMVRDQLALEARIKRQSL